MASLFSLSRFLSFEGRARARAKSTGPQEITVPRFFPDRESPGRISLRPVTVQNPSVEVSYTIIVCFWK